MYQHAVGSQNKLRAGGAATDPASGWWLACMGHPGYDRLLRAYSEHCATAGDRGSASLSEFLGFGVEIGDIRGGRVVESTGGTSARFVGNIGRRVEGHVQRGGNAGCTGVADGGGTGVSGGSTERSGGRSDGEHCDGSGVGSGHHSAGSDGRRDGKDCRTEVVDVVDAESQPEKGRNYRRNQVKREKRKKQWQSGERKSSGESDSASGSAQTGSTAGSAQTVDTRTGVEIEAAQTLAARRVAENKLKIVEAKVAAKLAEHRLKALNDKARSLVIDRLAAARLEEKINTSKKKSQDSFKGCDSPIESVGSALSAHEFAFKQQVRKIEAQKVENKYKDEQLKKFYQYATPDVRQMVAEIPEPYIPTDEEMEAEDLDQSPEPTDEEMEAEAARYFS